MTEVKWLVGGEAWPALLKALGDDVVRREITFYDTQDRALHREGVILRARSNDDGEVDTTVKLRGPRAANADERFDGRDGFKREADASIHGTVPAVAWKVKAKTKGGEPAFTAAQLGLLDVGGALVRWSALGQYGPTHALRARREEITAERWSIGDQAVVEVSTRGDAHPDAQLRALQRWLDQTGIATDGGLAGGKTLWAMTRHTWRPFNPRG